MKIRLIAVIAFLLSAIQVYADTGQIRSINAFPTMSVADARSTVTITAIIVNSKGSPVPDGTQVTFSATLGNFRSEVVTTTSGRAQAILVAGGVPGTSLITVRAAGCPPATYEFEFLSDRSLLSSAKEFVEIVAPGYMTFSQDEKIIGAAGPNHGVHLRYRDIEIEADDIQFNIPAYELRMKKAHVKMGAINQDFDECFLKLNQRKGFGTTTYVGATPVSMKGFGRGFAMVNEDRQRYGLVEISSSSFKPYSKALSIYTFEFKDLSESMSMVSAKKAVVFPRKEVQFQKAEVIVGGVKVLKMPLYSVSLTNGATLVTDQIIQVNDNQLAVDYPYYLSLKPGETSALRLRTGERYGRGTGVSRGIFLDYELGWNRGDDMVGGLTVSNIARQDWSIGLKQFYRLDSRSTASAFLEMPAGKSIYGNMNYSRQLDGWTLGFFGNASQTLRGSRFGSESYSMMLEKDPTKIGNLPFKLYYGLTADYARLRSNAIVQGNVQSSITDHAGYGLRVRTQSDPIRLDSKTSMNASLAVSKLGGRNVNSGLTFLGSASITRQVSSGAAITAIYDYANDPLYGSALGQHRLSMQAFYNAGRTGFTFFGSRSLDIDRSSYYLDLNYRVSGLWRLMGSYTLDRSLGESYMDYNLTVAYRLGIREFGLTWSHRTNRLGIQVFGATFN